MLAMFYLVDERLFEEFQLHTIRFLPSPPSSKSQACPCRPRSSLEEQDREHHTKGETDGRADEEGGYRVVPLGSRIIVSVVRVLVWA